MRDVLSFFLMGAFLAMGAVPADAEPMTPFVQAAHYGFSGVIAKIRSGILFVKTEKGLQPRTISPAKADRVGLHESTSRARIGFSRIIASLPAPFGTPTPIGAKSSSRLPTDLPVMRLTRWPAASSPFSRKVCPSRSNSMPTT